MGTNSAGEKVKKRGKTKFRSKTAMHAVKNDTQVYYSLSFSLSLLPLCLFSLYLSLSSFLTNEKNFSDLRTLSLSEELKSQKTFTIKGQS